MFEKFEEVSLQNILVVGDIILDKYIDGNTSRISPEAPVPIVHKQSESYVLGGAANVAHNLISMGAQSTLIGILGKDENGDKSQELIKRNLSNIDGLLFLNRTTTTKTRIVSKGQQLLRIDDENDTGISSEEEKELLEIVRNVLSKSEFTGMILQDYNKGLFTKSFIHKVINLAQQKSIPIFVDPKHKNFWNFKGATIFKPNYSEIVKANKEEDYKSLQDLLQNSFSKLNCDILFCTLAEDGISYVTNDKLVITPTEKIDVVDVSGAGDSALSIITLAYLLGYDLDTVSKLANLCGKVVCMKTGVSTITLKELKKAFKSV
ncbi:MAG: bifunctional ADP-heptose synthase [Saprospiraceae bacterium]|nr:bifunctional ADP-heptose synthase [Saprospiraceae bacterium]